MRDVIPRPPHTYERPPGHVRIIAGSCSIEAAGGRLSGLRPTATCPRNPFNCCAGSPDAARSKCRRSGLARFERPREPASYSAAERDRELSASLRESAQRLHAEAFGGLRRCDAFWRARGNSLEWPSGPPFEAGCTIGCPGAQPGWRRPPGLLGARHPVGFAARPDGAAPPGRHPDAGICCTGRVRGGAATLGVSLPSRDPQA